MPIRLYKTWTRTNDGPWIFPLVLTSTEIDSVLLPYQDLMRATPGFINKLVHQDQTLRAVIYQFSAIEGAQQLYRQYTDRTIAAVARYDDFVAQRAAEKGSTYALSWRITRKP